MKPYQQKVIMASSNLFARIAICSTLSFAAILPVAAQTWQPMGKTATIPIAATNSPCNSSTDTVGITADRSSLLTCQSGSWTSISGAGTALCHLSQFSSDASAPIISEGTDYWLIADAYYLPFATRTTSNLSTSSTGHTTEQISAGLTNSFESLGDNSTSSSSCTNARGIYCVRVAHYKCVKGAYGVGVMNYMSTKDYAVIQKSGYVTFNFAAPL